MKKTGLQSMGAALLKTLLIFASFILIGVASRLIFKSNLFDEEMLSERAVGIWNTVFMLLIFESTVFAFHRHDESAKRTFLEKYMSGKRFGKLGSVFSSLDFYVELLGIALLSFLLPLSLTYDCVGQAIWQEGYTKARVMLVVLPALLLLSLFAHVSVRRIWVSDMMQKTAKAKKEATAFARTVKGVLILALVYCLASLVLPWILPTFVTIANLGGSAIVFLYIAIALLAVILGVIASVYVRAMLKRKEFIEKLKKACVAQGAVISDIQRPYLSVFFQRKGVDFTLQSGKESYACKLVAGVFPGSPMIFSDTGEGVRQDTLRFFKVDILHLNTRIDYRMEDAPKEQRKIVIILPVPKNIYASVRGDIPRPADTGEIVGSYTVYNATGFLGALERGILGKK